MREIIEKVYTIDELDEVGKAFAIAKYKERNDFPGYGWYKPIIEGCKEDLEKKGYINTDIAFSGFWSQGDGASFTGDVDIKKWLTLRPDNKNYQRILKLINETYILADNARIVRDKYHHYVHENTTIFYVDFRIGGHLGTDAKRVIEILDKIEEEIDQEIKKLNIIIYGKLQKYYGEITTDEAVIEEIKGEELEFYENGRLYA